MRADDTSKLLARVSKSGARLIAVFASFTPTSTVRLALVSTSSECSFECLNANSEDFEDASYSR